MGKARRLRKMIKKIIHQSGPAYEYVSDHCYEDLKKKELKFNKMMSDDYMKALENWRKNQF